MRGGEWWSEVTSTFVGMGLGLIILLLFIFFVQPKVDRWLDEKWKEDDE